MSAISTPINRQSRSARKLEKPRPLKLGQSSHIRHSVSDARLGTVEEIMSLTDSVVSHLVNGNYDKILQANIKNLHGILKLFGSKLESIYKDQLDRAFVVFRNSCRDENLDYVSRLLLLELIELRATQWAHHDFASLYYKNKLAHVDLDTVTTPTLDNAFTPTSLYSPISLTGTPPPQPLLLGPGELVKSSGKYPSPTKVLGKNYCKDEVVIRNSDSGKVNPGAKERLVQITGPTEEKINYAKQLMEETIRRNASPVRAEVDGERLGSTSSLNSSTSDDSLLQGGKRTSLLHSFSTNDATLGEYKYTVTVGDENIKITGTNLDLVRIAKLVLDEYFSPGTDDYGDEIFEHIERPHLIPTQEIIETDDAIQSLREVSIRESPSRDTKEDIESMPRSKIIGNYGPPAGLIKYSPEQIIMYADSPLSKLTPADWVRVVRDCPAILRKTPIEWLDATTILQRRTLEGSSIITAHAPSSPQPSEQEQIA